MSINTSQLRGATWASEPPSSATLKRPDPHGPFGDALLTTRAVLSRQAVREQQQRCMPKGPPGHGRLMPVSHQGALLDETVRTARWKAALDRYVVASSLKSQPADRNGKRALLPERDTLADDTMEVFVRDRQGRNEWTAKFRRKNLLEGVGQ